MSRSRITSTSLSETLTERSRNHWLIAMSNLQATARHREGQLSRFREYFASAVEEDPLMELGYLSIGVELVWRYR